MSDIFYDKLTKFPDDPAAAEFEQRAEAIKQKHMDDLKAGKAKPRQGYHGAVKPPRRSKRLSRPQTMSGRILAACRALANADGELKVDDLITHLGGKTDNPVDRNTVVTMVRYLRRTAKKGFPYRVLCRGFGRYGNKKCEVPIGPRRPSPVAKRKWTDPDELAQQIYAILTAGKGLLQPSRAQLALREAAELRAEVAPGGRIFQQSPQMRAGHVQAQAAAASAVGAITGGISLPIAQTVLEVARAKGLVPEQPIPLGHAAAPVRHQDVAHPIANQLPGPVARGVQAVSPIAAAVQAVLAGRRAVPFLGVPELPAALNQQPGAPEPAAVPAIRDVVPAPGRRPGASVPQVLATLTPTPGPSLNRTSVEQLTPVGSDQPDVMPNGQDAFVATAPQVNDAPRKPYTDELGHVPRLTRIPMESLSNLIVAIDRYGLPQMTGSGASFQPGKGHATVLDFDGTNLTAYATDPIVVFNMSILPMSGTTITRARLLGTKYFVEPTIFCHGVVAGAISACAGIVPGTGTVTPYYLSAGSMIAGTNVTVENWFSATAAVGKHVGIVWVDGTGALVVLDC